MWHKSSKVQSHIRSCQQSAIRNFPHSNSRKLRYKYVLSETVKWLVVNRSSRNRFSYTSMNYVHCFDMIYARIFDCDISINQYLSCCLRQFLISHNRYWDEDNSICQSYPGSTVINMSFTTISHHFVISMTLNSFLVNICYSAYLTLYMIQHEWMCTTSILWKTCISLHNYAKIIYLHQKISCSRWKNLI